MIPGFDGSGRSDPLPRALTPVACRTRCSERSISPQLWRWPQSPASICPSAYGRRSAGEETKAGQTGGNFCFDGNNERFTLFVTAAKKEQPREEYNLRFRDQD